eukprot:TRINITY_DN20440_c0_g1_i1.p1 TRINITY_DN20440_c0_g1~~TRINITY_DN20440_c0_g1_i1.p1  ORF type:complete len:334 (-),score=64.25 TRINITY_DN20440_c0_g1_i1:8-1009(-)
MNHSSSPRQYILEKYAFNNDNFIDNTKRIQQIKNLDSIPQSYSSEDDNNPDSSGKSNVNSPQFPNKIKKIIIENRQRAETHLKSNFSKRTQLENIYKSNEVLKQTLQNKSTKLQQHTPPQKLQGTRIIPISSQNKPQAKQFSPKAIQNKEIQQTFTFFQVNQSIPLQKSTSNPNIWSDQINNLMQIPSLISKELMGQEQQSQLNQFITHIREFLFCQEQEIQQQIGQLLNQSHSFVKEISYAQAVNTYFKEYNKLMENYQTLEEQMKNDENTIKAMSQVKQVNQQQLINTQIQENTKLQSQVKELQEKINNQNEELDKLSKVYEKVNKQKNLK